MSILRCGLPHVTFATLMVLAAAYFAIPAWAAALPMLDPDAQVAELAERTAKQAAEPAEEEGRAPAQNPETAEQYQEASAAEQQQEASEAEQEDQDPGEEASPSREIIPFPVLISDPTNGFGAGGGLLTLYRLNKTAAVDSQTAAFGYYTTTSSWKWGFEQVLSFTEDSFRSTTTAIFGDTNNNFSYTDFPGNVVFGERQDRVSANFTYRVVRDLFVGVSYRYAETNFSFEAGTEAEQEFSQAILGLAGAQETTDSGIGLFLAYDTRDQEYTPTGGTFANFELLDFATWIGSDFSYRTVDTFYNRYWSVRPGHLLAFRFRWRAAFGDIPFTGESTYGGVDLRAYPTGKYRGKGMLAGQVEYRFNLWKRLGGVAFAGSGRVYGQEPTLGADQVLPSGGAGVRFLILKDRGTQVGLDYARGRFGNSGVYFFFGEAF